MNLSKTLPLRKNGIIYRTLGEETLLIFGDDKIKDKEVIMILNSTGTEIWNLIDGKKTVKEIIEILLDRFAVEREMAEREVMVFLTQMMSKELINTRDLR